MSPSAIFPSTAAQLKQPPPYGPLNDGHQPRSFDARRVARAGRRQNSAWASRTPGWRHPETPEPGPPRARRPRRTVHRFRVPSLGRPARRLCRRGPFRPRFLRASTARACISPPLSTNHLPLHPIPPLRAPRLRPAPQPRPAALYTKMTFTRYVCTECLRDVKRRLERLPRGGDGGFARGQTMVNGSGMLVWRHAA